MRPFLRVIMLAACLSGAAGPAGADIWGVKTHDPVSQPPTTLFRITADGSTLTVISTVSLDGNAIEVDGLALDARHDLYGFQLDAAGSRLVAIDPQTAVATPRGPSLAGRDIRGAAFAAGGQLLALDAANDRLLEITATTGEPAGPGVALTLDGAPFDVFNLVDLVEIAPGAMVLAQFTEFFSLDAATGALVRLHRDEAVAGDGFTVGFSGLAWLPEAIGGPRLAAYDVQQDDDVFAYDPADGYRRTDLHRDIISNYNAGRGDLASTPAYVAAVDDPVPAGGFTALDIHPNPCNPRARISFTLPAEDTVTVSIHDLAGRRVRLLARREFAAGPQALAWDGCDDAGRPVPTGVYVCRTATGTRTAWRCLTLIR